QNFEGDRSKFAAYGKGESVSGREWGNLMNILDTMKARGLWVILLAHSGAQTVKNPLGDDYLKAVPVMGKDKLAMTVKYADAILYMDFIVAQKDVNKQSHVGKAVGCE